MHLNSAEADLLMATMFLLPLALLVWRAFRCESWTDGLILFAVLAVPLFMGVISLCGRVLQSRTLSRSEGRVAFVDFYEASFFEQQTEPIFLPEGAQAYLKEELKPRRVKQPGMSSTYTSYEVYLGSPAGPSHRMDGSADRAKAQAQADALNDFVRGDAPRMELLLNDGGGRGVMLFWGVFLYGLSLTGLVAAMWGTVKESRLFRKKPHKPHKGSGPAKRRGRKRAR